MHKKREVVMKLLSKFKVSRENDGPRKFSFELTMSGIISLIVVAVLGVTWVFILGVLVGRGYKPENAVPELAQMMPTTESSAPAESGEAPTVLKAEDLQFMENLQGKAKEGDMIIVESTTTPSASPEGGQAKDPAGVETYDLDKAEGPAVETSNPEPEPAKQLAETDMKAKKPKAETKSTASAPAAPAVEIAKEEPQKPAEAKSGGARFTAIYQIASFYKKEQAEAMVKKLAKNGLSPTIREADANGKHVYRIVITVTGTDQELSEAIKKTGEKGPMLLKKTPQ